MNISDVYNERPEKGSREAVEERCYELLERLGISYRRVDHEEAVNMEALIPIEEKLGSAICKNLFLTNRQQTDFYLLLMPGNKPFKTKFLSKQLGCARLSFASGEQLEELLGVRPGSASVLALENDKEKRVQLVIDAELKEQALFGCHPCRNTSSLAMDWSAVRDIVIPELGHDAVYVELPWNDEA